MRASILNGFELLHRSSFDTPGVFYSAFFQLSTGLERLMKVAFILDYKIENNLENPTNNRLRDLGHFILELYAKCNEIAVKRGLPTDGWFSGGGTVEYDILAFLSEFARGSRYYNLDRLVGSAKVEDPLVQWSRIQMALAGHCLSWQKREAVMQAARDHCDRLGLYGWERGPSGEYELTIDATYKREIFRLARGHCVWSIIGILRPFYDLFDRLCTGVHEIEASKGIEPPTVPCMAEFVPFLLCDRQTSIRRKNWLATYAT